MEFKEFTAGTDDNDRRLDRVIRKIAEKENLSGLYKAIRKGLVRVNGKKTEVSGHIFEGDKIKIPEFLLQTKDEDKTSLNNNAQPEKQKINASLDVVFQNEDLLVIDKPYDIPVHSAANSLEKSVVEFYSNNFPQKKSISFTPGPLHRLDRKTTGLLAFSMSLNGARWFSENIADHSIRKIYTAIVQEKLSGTQEWTDFISKEYSKGNAFQTVKVSAKSRETETTENPSGTEKSLLAKTKIIPVRYFEYKKVPCTLVEIEIQTGRTHQIRSQAAFHGFPLLGDTAYGGTEIYAEQDFFLHAKTLIFPENRLPGIPEKLEVKIPFAFEKFCKTDLLNI